MAPKKAMELVRVIANLNWDDNRGYKWKAGANNTYRARERLGPRVYLYTFYPDMKTWFQNGGTRGS
jgi:hypothetical protein